MLTLRIAATLACAALLAASTAAAGRQAAPGWTTLLDGTTLQGWRQVGTSNWKVADGVVEATSGAGMLVTPEAYSDFELRAEVWVSDDANSGIFFRAGDPDNVTPETAYEMNIFDKRPDVTYRTGAIVGVARPLHWVDAGSHWNTIEIAAKGRHLSVTINGVRTVDVDDGARARGVIALQCASGAVKFRRVQIRVLPTTP